MRHGYPGAGQGVIPADRHILSKNMIGHGSATSAVLRVDLDNDVVIAQTRRRAGTAFDRYLIKVLLAVEESLLK
jgi:hypothetical protein